MKLCHVLSAKRAQKRQKGGGATNRLGELIVITGMMMRVFEDPQIMAIVPFAGKLRPGTRV
jgi:hypothetical protein